MLCVHLFVFVLVFSVVYVIFMYCDDVHVCVCMSVLSVYPVLCCVLCVLRALTCSFSLLYSQIYECTARRTTWELALGGDDSGQRR